MPAGHACLHQRNYFFWFSDPDALNSSEHASLLLLQGFTATASGLAVTRLLLLQGCYCNRASLLLLQGCYCYTAVTVAGLHCYCYRAVTVTGLHCHGLVTQKESLLFGSMQVLLAWQMKVQARRLQGQTLARHVLRITEVCMRTILHKR